MTPEEIERQKQERALSAAQTSASAQPTQIVQPQAPQKESGGIFTGDTRTVLTGTPTRTGDVTKTIANVATLGMAPNVANKVGNVAKDVDTATRGFFAKLDPTNTRIPKASTAGIDAAQGGLQDAATRASGISSTIAKNPITAQTVAVQDPGAASIVVGQAPIVSDQIRGTTQQVTSGGNIVSQGMSPAQVAEIERMQASGISREDAEYRTRQSALASSLEASASGQGPSLADAQLQRANEAAIKTQAALAASARGGNPILAQRQAAMNTATIQQDNAAKSAELRLSEALQARGQLGQVLDSARGQDISVATAQAGLNQDAAKTNAGAQNTANLADAGFVQDASKTNATLAQDTAKTNAQQTLTRDMFNSEQDFKAAQADQSANLEADKLTALNNINTDQFNAKAKDEMSRFKTDVKLRADVANQAATLQAQGMTLDAIAKFMGLEQDSLKAVLSSETAKFTSEQDRLSAQKKGETGMGGSILSSIGTVVAMCFPAGEQVVMANGVTTKNIEDVEVGDALYGSVVLETREYISSEALYQFANATMTGSHAVWTGDEWATAAEVGLQVGEAMERDVYTLVTSTGTMVVGGALVGDDNHDADELNTKECA